MDLTVYSLDGRLVMQKILYYQGSGIELSTKQMEAGIYFLRCSIGNFSGVNRLVVFK
jgi:hypothetical protein